MRGGLLGTCGLILKEPLPPRLSSARDGCGRKFRERSGRGGSACQSQRSAKKGKRVNKRGCEDRVDQVCSTFCVENIKTVDCWFA